MSSIVDKFFARCARKYARLTPSGLVNYVRNVVTCMTAIPAFSGVKPALPVVTTAVDDLDTKTQAAMNRGKLEVALRNASRRFMLTIMGQLGKSVDIVADGSLDVIVSSGFDAVRAPSPVGPVNTPQNLRVTQGKLNGQLAVRLKKAGTNGKTFSIQHADAPDGPWIDHEPFTKSTTTVDDLAVGKMHWVRARANGAGGVSEWTTPCCAMALQKS